MLLLLADTPNLLPAIVLMSLALGGSLVIWSQLLFGEGRALPAASPPVFPSVTWSPWPLAVVLGWLTMAGAASLQVSSEPARSAAEPEIVVLNTVVGMGIVAILLLLLHTSDPRGLAPFGITRENWVLQVRLGCQGLLIAIGPVALSLWATAALRPPETQHAYLQLLSNQPGPVLIALMVFAVCVVAPLLEELLFRVIFQGWLRQAVGRWTAILTTAIAFAVIHGWRDSLPLLPLAVVLGWLYDRHRSYLAVVVTHGLFNGLMLTLQLLATRE